MLKQHRVHVTRTIEIDLLHLQVQFLYRNACIGFYLNIDDAYDLPIYVVSGISRGD